MTGDTFLGGVALLRGCGDGERTFLPAPGGLEGVTLLRGGGDGDRTFLPAPGGLFR